MSSPQIDQTNVRRFLVDENMPRTLAPALRSAGYDAEDARDVGLRGRPDSDVWAYAQAHSQTLITYDREFGNTLMYPEPHAGIVVGDRIDHFAPDTQVRLILSGLTSLQGQTLADAVVIVAPGRVRVHRSTTLP
jgi:predicted nuclease of predicted toxin-antitoxin system